MMEAMMTRISKRFLLCSGLIYLGISLWSTVGAEDSPPQAKLDLVIPPASPVLVLLGVEPTVIEKPGSPTDLAVSVLNATDFLSVVPRDYAIEFSPYWWIKDTGTNYQSYWGQSSLLETFWQTATLSLATATREIPESDSFVTSLGLGLRFSLRNGEISYKDTVDVLLNKVTELWIEQDDISDERKAATDSVARDSLQAIYDSLKRVEIVALRRIDEIVPVIIGKRLNRVDFKLDFSGAAAFDFPQAQFDQGSFSKLGVWATGGWERNWFGLLGTLRYLHDGLTPERTSVDAGARLVANPSEHFSISAEWIYRRFLDPSQDPASHHRYDIALDYALTKNNLLSFSFGKDYGDLLEGELIASISLKQGFGSTRPIPTKPQL